MSHDLARDLAALADRADTHVVADRVPSVHRRARRASAVRGAAAAGALVAVVAIGVARSDSRPFVKGRDAAPAHPRPPVASLVVDLREDDQLNATVPRRLPGARAIVVVHVHGLVPKRPVADVSPSGRENLLGFTISAGGGRQGSTVADTRCGTGSVLVPVDDEFPVELPFDAPGRYTVTYRTAACPPLGKVSASIEVTAR